MYFEFKAEASWIPRCLGGALVAMIKDDLGDAPRINPYYLGLFFIIVLAASRGDLDAFKLG